MKSWQIGIAVLAQLAGLTACNDPLGTGSAVLLGEVVRGPIRPVCVEGEACEAPFAARFEIRRGGRLTASFRTDDAGRFSIRLAPGMYSVIPGPDAPIMNPGGQAQTVEVRLGQNEVKLRFDTGIR